MTERQQQIQSALAKIREIRQRSHKNKRFKETQASRNSEIEGILTSPLSLCLACEALIIIFKDHGVDLDCNRGNSPITLWTSRQSLLDKPACKDYEHLQENGNPT